MKFIPCDTYKVYMRKMDLLNTLENRDSLSYEARKDMVIKEMCDELYDKTVEGLLEMCDRSIKMENFHEGEKVYRLLKDRLMEKLLNSK